MKLKLIKKNELKVSSWSGGTTTQLAIYPESAIYAEKNFQFRISTATVEVKESDFTKLTGVSRKLMILNGTLKLEHLDRYTKTLNKFDIDTFEGDWQTKSFGRVTDFNLMTTGDTSGEIKGLSIKEGLVFDEILFTTYDIFTLYNFKGNIKININEVHLDMNTGDVLILKKEKSGAEINIKAIKDCELAITKIKL